MRVVLNKAAIIPAKRWSRNSNQGLLFLQICFYVSLYFYLFLVSNFLPLVMVRLFTLMRHPIIQALQAKERVSKVELLTNLANVMSTFFTSQLTLDPRTTIRPSIAGFQCMALVWRCRMLAFTERSLKNVSFFQGGLCTDSFSNLSCELAFLVDFCGASQILERKHKLSS